VRLTRRGRTVLAALVLTLALVVLVWAAVKDATYANAWAECAASGAAACP
jgi:hypothetical protein